MEQIKNPIVKFGVFILLLMTLGIGAVWIILGIISPVLLILLIQHWK